MAEPLRLLVVCLGNICRSPMAEGVLRARLADAGIAVQLDSAGTGDWHAGQPPDSRAVAAARHHGVDISGLRARTLRASDFEDFDWLLCADHANLRDVRARAPANAAARMALLTEWAGLEGAVPDPYTGGADDFERVWRQLDTVAVGVARRLRRDASGDNA